MKNVELKVPKTLYIRLAKPKRWRRWPILLWNADIFLYEIPMLKTTVLVSWLGAGLIGWLV